MKKVTLGLLITFVAVAMVAGPKPTPTPSVQKGRGLGIAAHKEAAPTTPTPGTPVGGALTFGRDSLKGSTREVAPTTPTTCCQDWNNNGECVKWGPTSGGCPSAPRLRAPTTTPNAAKSMTIRDLRSSSDREVKPSGEEPTPGEVGVTTVNTSKSNTFKTRNQPAGGIVIPTTKEVKPTTPPSPPNGEKNVTPSASGDKTTTTNNSKSNSYKEVASPAYQDGEDMTKPKGAPVEPTAGPIGITTIKSTKSNASERTGPTNPEPNSTPGPVGSINLNSSRSNIYREGAPVTVTPTSGPVGATTVKGSRSNGSERNSGHASESKPKPTPTKRAGLK